MNDSNGRHSPSLIRAAGLRVTRQRVAVLDAVDADPHTSTAAVFATVSTVLPGVSHQAVYDCLADLTDTGLLRRLVVGGGPALYETRTHDNHQHFVCRACELVLDVDCAIDLAACRSMADAAGFVVDEAEVTYRGLCRPCAAARSVPVSDVQSAEGVPNG